MSQNKTVFQFKVNANIAMVETVIRNWLAANQYQYEARPNANYYAYNDPMLKGKRGLEYYINGDVVTILAYMGTFEKPMALEGFVGALPKQSYRNDLNPLFEELKKLENAGQTQGYYTAVPMNNTMAVNGQPTPMQQPNYNQQQYQQAAPVQLQNYNQQQQYQQQPYQQQPYQQPNVQQNQAFMANNSLNTFTEQNNKKIETFVIVGFIMSIVGILLTCAGFVPGALFLLFEYYAGIQGLKTRKKGLAIATIVLASIGALLFILNLALSVMAI